MNSITVLLADDHTLVRKGFRSLLGLARDITVIGEAQNGREAVALTKLHKPDVVIMDYAMPLLNGLEATQQIQHECPDTKVIILSGHNDEAHIHSVVAIGAAGYLFKQTSAELLVQAIREVHAGNRIFNPAITRHLEGQRSNSSGRWPSEKNFMLTSRELEVIQLIAESHGNKQVAAILGISTKTAGKHRQNVMDKLNIHDTAGLTRYAIARGIIDAGSPIAAII